MFTDFGGRINMFKKVILIFIVLFSLVNVVNAANISKVNGSLLTASAGTANNIVMSDPAVSTTSRGIYDTVSINAVVLFGSAIGQAVGFGGYVTTNASVSTNAICSAVALKVGTGQQVVLREGTLISSAWAWSASLSPILYLDPATGGFTQTCPVTAGQRVQICGEVKSATKMYFRPSQVTWVVK